MGATRPGRPHFYFIRLEGWKLLAGRAQAKGSGFVAGECSTDRAVMKTTRSAAVVGEMSWRLPKSVRIEWDRFSTYR